MAVTGEGTAENPYLVETWQDFKSVCSESNKYIECIRENLVWDMNIEEPDGISVFKINIASFKGKNVTIKNAYCQYTGMFVLYNSNGDLNIENINLINFYYSTSDVNPYADYPDYPGIISTKGNVNIFNCRFSGVINNNCLFYDHSSVRTVNIKNSSFNVRFLGASRFIQGHPNNYGDYIFRNCLINLSGVSSENMLHFPSKKYFYNIKFTGKMPWSEWDSSWYVYTSVYDCLMSTRSTGSIYGHYDNCLINKEKYTGNYYPSKCKFLTSAQMVDESELNLVGFPAVDIRNQ